MEYVEYLPWCPNCGAMADESEDWEETMMDEDELTVVFNAEDEVQALLYRNMLEEAGIHVLERPLEAEWFEGVKQSGLHSQLLVRDQDAEQASALVEAFMREADSGELSAEIPEQGKDDTEKVKGEG
jgi:hypothetical protein